MSTPKAKPVPTAAMRELAHWLVGQCRSGGTSTVYHEGAVEVAAAKLAVIDAEAYERGRADEREDARALLAAMRERLGYSPRGG